MLLNLSAELYCTGEDDVHEDSTASHSPYTDSQPPKSEPSNPAQPGSYELEPMRHEEVDDLGRVAKRLVASAVAKAVQRVIMEGRMVRVQVNILCSQYMSLVITSGLAVKSSCISSCAAHVLATKVDKFFCFRVLREQRA